MTVFADNRPLLDAFKRGEGPALTQVFETYVDGVDIVVRRGFPAQDGKSVKVPGITDRDLQRELVQETFARAFSEKARHSFDGLRPYRPYILRIARNLMIDFWRKSGRELALDSDDNGASAWIERWSAAEAEPGGFEEDLHWRTLRMVALDYMRALSPELQKFVGLRFEQGRSQHDLVRELGWTRWKVRSLEKQVLDGLTRELKRRKLTGS